MGTNTTMAKVFEAGGAYIGPSPPSCSSSRRRRSWRCGCVALNAMTGEARDVGGACIVDGAGMGTPEPGGDEAAAAAWR